MTLLNRCNKDSSYDIWVRACQKLSLTKYFVLRCATYSRHFRGYFRKIIFWWFSSSPCYWTFIFSDFVFRRNIYYLLHLKSLIRTRIITLIDWAVLVKIIIRFYIFVFYKLQETWFRLIMCLGPGLQQATLSMLCSLLCLQLRITPWKLPPPAPWPHHGSLLELGFCLNKLCSDVCCWCLLTADCWLPRGDEAQKLEFYQTNNTKSGKLKSLWRFLRESLPRGVWPRGVQNGAALGLLESGL